MIVLLSPTKQMDFSGKDLFTDDLTTPVFQKEAEFLIQNLEKYSKKNLIELMKISNKIADNTLDNVKKFNLSGSTGKSAIFAYSGTVYSSLGAGTLNFDDLSFVKKHVRILSGLYGILHPNDMVNPYRLEMKTPLVISKRENLYHFWRSRIVTSLLNEQVLQNKHSFIINLASLEYLKAIDISKLKTPLISLYFQERLNKEIRTVGMYSKVARGLMARRIIKERITDPFLLQIGETAGYFFDSNLSNKTEWIFVREEIKK